MSDFKNNLDDDMEDKLFIGACGGDPNARNNPNGGCMCKNGFGQKNGIGACVACTSLDLNSKGDGAGGCMCKPKFIFDSAVTKKCQNCQYYDFNSKYNT